MYHAARSTVKLIPKRYTLRKQLGRSIDTTTITYLTMLMLHEKLVRPRCQLLPSCAADFLIRVTPASHHGSGPRQVSKSNFEIEANAAKVPSENLKPVALGQLPTHNPNGDHSSILRANRGVLAICFAHVKRLEIEVVDFRLTDCFLAGGRRARRPRALQCTNEEYRPPPGRFI